MRTLITLIISISSFAQGINFGNSDNAQLLVFVDPTASVKEDGLNIGVEFKGVLRGGYIGVSSQSFSALQGGYNDFVVSGGVNLNSGLKAQNQYYLGGRLGRIWRTANNETRGANLLGFECGYNYNFKNWFLGLKATYNYRQDNKIFYNDNGYWRESGFIVFGFNL